MTMIARSTLGLTGEVSMRVYRCGALVAECHDPNLCLQVPRERISRLLGHGEDAPLRITKIRFGTNGTLPALADVDITEPFEKGILGVSYPSPGIVRFTFSLLGGEANGKAIRELGLVCEDGSLFCRWVRGVIEKDSDVEAEGSWTISV